MIAAARPTWGQPPSVVQPSASSAAPLVQGILWKHMNPIDADPLLQLRGSGPDLWADEHADEYVRRLRKDWDDRTAWEIVGEEAALRREKNS